MGKGSKDSRTPNFKTRRINYDLIDWGKDKDKKIDIEQKKSIIPKNE